MIGLLLSREDVAELLRVPLTEVDSLIEAGQVGVVRRQGVAGQPMVLAVDVVALVDSQTVRAGQPSQTVPAPWGPPVEVR